MRKGWQELKLSDVCRLINGRAYKKDELLDKGKYPVLRVGNFFTNNHWYYSDLELDDDKYCINGDLLYAWSASFGPRIWDGSKSIYHYHIWKIVPDYGLVTKEFLFHLLEWDKEKIKEKHGTGTTMMHVGKGSMEKRLVPIPPLAEQKQIVAILDQAFAAIDQAKANIRQNIDNARELFQSKLNEVFSQKGDGWEDKKLGNVCEGFQYGTSKKAITEVSKYVVLRMGNIQDGKIDWEDLKYSDDNDDIEKLSLNTGDVLFNRTNSAELVGKCAIYKGEQPAIFAGYLIRINRNKQLLDGDYLNYVMNSSKVREFGFSIMTSSVNQANISASKLAEYVIPIPPIAQQKIISQELDEIKSISDGLIENYNYKIQALNELKKSILQRAFSGELTELSEAGFTGLEDSQDLSIAAEPPAKYGKK